MGAEIGEEIEAVPVEVAVPDVADEEEEVSRVKPGAPDTPPHPQSPVVNAITFMVTRLGTAWHQLLVHG